MRALWLLLLVSCAQDRERAPTRPGGPGGGDTTPGMIDAPDGTDDGSAVIAGRVCLVADLRLPTAGCAATGADNITVTLGTKTALTAVDGTFTIAVPSGSSLTWRATGAAIISSVMPFSVDFVIPAITVDNYGNLLITNGVLLSPGQGSVIARVVQGATLTAGATASAQPTPQFATLYDGISPTAWQGTATATFGVAWVTGIPVGATTLTATPPSGNPQAAVIPVEDQAITFVTIEIP